jgi:hypothetical protein
MPIAKGRLRQVTLTGVSAKDSEQFGNKRAADEIGNASG